MLGVKSVTRLLGCAAALLVGPAIVLAQNESLTIDKNIVSAVAANQSDLASEGYALLLREASSHNFFLLGELHGTNEVPALIDKLWPEMWKQGYRHVGAEISPWAAHQLEFVPKGEGPSINGTWTREQSSVVHSLAGAHDTVIWGCDMEEIQPQYPIRDLAALNPGDKNLERMVALTANGYSRPLAPELLSLLSSSPQGKDTVVNGISLRQNLMASLQIEKDRMSKETRPAAQARRELLMKQQFLEHYREGDPGKVLIRFGQAHLFRGLDNDRGISTLGNFIAEFALTQNSTVFNVAVFGAGGEYRLLGRTFSADQRQDELAFAWLAAQAKAESTVFNMRPLRPLLHALGAGKRSALEESLMYWADSYDALICYKSVTPLASGH
jgi:hypothetical protein